MFKWLKKVFKPKKEFSDDNERDLYNAIVDYWADRERDKKNRPECADKIRMTPNYSEMRAYTNMNNKQVHRALNGLRSRGYVSEDRWGKNSKVN